MNSSLLNGICDHIYETNRKQSFLIPIVICVLLCTPFSPRNQFKLIDGQLSPIFFHLKIHISELFLPLLFFNVSFQIGVLFHTRIILKITFILFYFLIIWLYIAFWRRLWKFILIWSSAVTVLTGANCIFA